MDAVPQHGAQFGARELDEPCDVVLRRHLRLEAVSLGEHEFHGLEEPRARGREVAVREPAFDRRCRSFAFRGSYLSQLQSDSDFWIVFWNAHEPATRTFEFSIVTQPQHSSPLKTPHVES